MSTCNCAKCRQRNAPFVLNGASFNPAPADESDMLGIPTINWSADPHGKQNKKVPPPFARGQDEDEDDITENAAAEDLLPLPQMQW